MTDLYLCVDPGGSQTKFFYQLPEQQTPNYLLMSPLVEPISRQQLDSYFSHRGWLGSPAAIQQAWLEVENQVFVVGDFASRFDPDDRLAELKYENALYKVLAAVGVILQNHQISSRKKISLHLALLLPWNEYNDRQRFQGKISSLLAHFSFRGQSYKVNLAQFLCRPEGGGLAALRILDQGVDWLQQRKLGVLMLGHRNTTALYFEYGELRTGDSPLIGFSLLLDRVISLTSGLNRDLLAAAIFQGIELHDKNVYLREKYHSCSDCTETEHPDWSQLDAIGALATAKDAGLRQQEVMDIASAITTATSDYWLKLDKWLRKVLPPDLDEVILSGGAARFLMPELESYFNCEPQLESLKNKHGYVVSHDRKVRSGKYQPLDSKKHFTPIVWGAAEQQKGLEASLSRSDKRSSLLSLGYRLVDAYGLFNYLMAKNQKVTSAPVVGSPR